jgi:hypothetical protein
MSEVLLMPALEISHAIEVFVLMKANDLSWYPKRSCLRGLHMAATSSCVAGDWPKPVLPQGTVCLRAPSPCDA